jgi:MFS family permease
MAQPFIPTRPRRLFYGWVLVGVAALVMIVGTVPLFGGMTAWFVVLERQFGWSRTQLTGAFALTRVEGSIMGPVSGYLVERLGPRKMVALGLTIAGGGFLILAATNSLWQLYLAFVVMSVGTGLGSWLPMMTVVNNWFSRRRAMAMAIAMEGFLIGGVILVPILAWAIDPDISGRPGWRLVAAALGIFLMAIAVPLSMLVRNNPEDYGQQPDGQAPVTTSGQAHPAPGAEEPNYTWQEAVRTKTFWLISIGHACGSIVIVTMMVHLGPLLDDRGFSLQTVGWVVATYTAVAAVFTLIGGYLGDRVPIRWAIFAFSAVQSVAVAVLVIGESEAMAYLFGVLLGIGFGGRSPLTTAIRGVYFGRKSFASITGISMIPMNVLLLASPLFAGIMFDATGTYTVSFAVISVVSFIGSALFLMLGPPAASRFPAVAAVETAAERPT